MTLPPDDISAGEYEEWLEIKCEIEALQESQHNERIKNMPITWTTRDGTKIPVTEMTDNHLQNAIAMLERMRDPLFFPYDGDGYDPGLDEVIAEHYGQTLENARAQVWLRVLRKEQRHRKNHTQAG